MMNEAWQQADFEELPLSLIWFEREGGKEVMKARIGEVEWIHDGAIFEPFIDPRAEVDEYYLSP